MRQHAPTQSLDRPPAMAATGQIGPPGSFFTVEHVDDAKP